MSGVCLCSLAGGMDSQRDRGVLQVLLEGFAGRPRSVGSFVWPDGSVLGHSLTCPVSWPLLSCQEGTLWG